MVFQLRLTLVCALPLILCLHPMPVLAAPRSLPGFLDDLYRECAQAYSIRVDGACEAMNRAHADCAENEANRRAIGQVLFVHELLTGSAAVDCAKGGILGIPYFWHWVDPNPRHSIVALPDSVPLSELEPPPGFDRYETYADVDRVPSLFFSDLLTDRPRYSSRDCGTFFTFGWCSEREMAFVALMRQLGYPGRIRSAGIHAWSELCCELIAEDGQPVRMVAHVDNTFDLVEWLEWPEGATLDEWLDDLEQDSETRWYNATARSADQHAALKALSVSAEVEKRIEDQVKSGLGLAGSQDSGRLNARRRQ